MPASLTESPAFRRWINYIKCSSTYNLPSRKRFMAELQERYRATQSSVTSHFSGINYISTTADCWSAHKRSFLGMTAHWIDPDDLSRKNAVLCCKELTVSHTHDALASVIDDVHHDYGIIHKVSLIFHAVVKF